MCTMQPLGSLHLLASEDDVPALKFLLENGADVDQRDEEGCTALHWAADRGSMQVSSAPRLCASNRNLSSTTSEDRDRAGFDADCVQLCHASLNGFGPLPDRCT